jgi:hypothetical protein
MVDQPRAYVKWLEEDVEGSGTHAGGQPRRVRAAWLVRDVAGIFGSERREVLAYLGQRPAITAGLQEEVAALYPDVPVDWDEIRRAVDGGDAATRVAAMSDDELALHLRALANERGLSLVDLSLRLGYRQRQVLPEVMALLDDPGRVARFERTSGSVFDYMADKHPEYAYLLVKARLFFEGDEAALAAAVAEEPAGFDDAAWVERRRFWHERLAAYRRARSAPSSEAPE